MYDPPKNMDCKYFSENARVYGDMLMHKKADEVLDLDVDYTRKFQVFIDHKIKSYRTAAL